MKGIIECWEDCSSLEDRYWLDGETEYRYRITDEQRARIDSSFVRTTNQMPERSHHAASRSVPVARKTANEVWADVKKLPEWSTPMDLTGRRGNSGAARKPRHPHRHRDAGRARRRHQRPVFAIPRWRHRQRLRRELDKDSRLAGGEKGLHHARRLRTPFRHGENETVARSSIHDRR